MNTYTSAHGIKSLRFGVIVADDDGYYRTIYATGNGWHELTLFALSEQDLMTPEEKLARSREDEYRAVCAEQSNALDAGRVLGFPQGYVPSGDCEPEMDAYLRWQNAGGKAPERTELPSMTF